MEKSKLVRFNQEEIRYLNQLRTIKQIKVVGNFLISPEVQVAKDGFAGLFYQTFKEQMTAMLYQMCWRMEKIINSLLKLYDFESKTGRSIEK